MQIVAFLGSGELAVFLGAVLVGECPVAVGGRADQAELVVLGVECGRHFDPPGKFFLHFYCERVFCL